MLTNNDLESLKEKLEVEFVDTIGLHTILEILADICYEKADHIRANWQDEITASTWEEDAGLLEDCVSKLNN